MDDANIWNEGRLPTESVEQIVPMKNELQQDLIYDNEQEKKNVALQKNTTQKHSMQNRICQQATLYEGNKPAQQQHGTKTKDCDITNRCSPNIKWKHSKRT